MMKSLPERIENHATGAGLAASFTEKQDAADRIRRHWRRSDAISRPYRKGAAAASKQNGGGVDHGRGYRSAPSSSQATIHIRWRNSTVPATAITRAVLRDIGEAEKGYRRTELNRRLVARRGVNLTPVRDSYSRSKTV
jgi:hypothetical protein